MTLLLDTCCFLWMISDESRLSAPAREALEDGGNTVVLHQISRWEIQIKYQSGKLRLAETPDLIIAEALHLHDINYQTLRDDAIQHLAKLPDHHKDPFDRILIASALVDGMRMVTPDHNIHRYPVPVIW